MAVIGNDVDGAGTVQTDASVARVTVEPAVTGSGAGYVVLQGNAAGTFEVHVKVEDADVTATAPDRPAASRDPAHLE